MVVNNSFLEKHLVDLAHSGVSLEGALATRTQVSDIIFGKSLNLDPKTTRIIQNISLAFYGSDRELDIFVTYLKRYYLTEA